MQQPARQSQRPTAAQGQEKQKNKTGGEADPRPELKTCPLRQIHIVLKPFFLRGRRGIFEDQGFCPVSPSEKPFQRHDHLAVRGDILKSVQIFIRRRHAFSCCDILRIAEHHGAFDRERHEVFMGYGEKFAEKALFDGPCVTDDSCDCLRFTVVIVRAHCECGETADKEQDQVQGTRMCFQKIHVSMLSSFEMTGWKVRRGILPQSGARHRIRVLSGAWKACCRKAVWRGLLWKPVPESYP